MAWNKRNLSNQDKISPTLLNPRTCMNSTTIHFKRNILKWGQNGNCTNSILKLHNRETESLIKMICMLVYFHMLSFCDCTHVISMVNWKQNVVTLCRKTRKQHWHKPLWRRNKKGENANLKNKIKKILKISP